MEATYQTPPEGYRVSNLALWKQYLTFTHLSYGEFKENFDKTLPHILRMRGIEKIKEDGKNG